MLRGGLGKKARAAVSDAIAARPPDSGIVPIATGSYLGERFDWPELDTLFLARGTFPPTPPSALTSQRPAGDDHPVRSHPAARPIGAESPAIVAIGAGLLPS